MRNLFWGIILVIFGVLLLLNNLGIADFEDVIRDYWPVLLVLWGVLILAKRRKEPAQGAMPESPPPPDSTSTAQQVERDLIHDSNVFGNTWLNISSQNFKGGSVSTIFGDCTVNLSQAAFAEGEHVLRVHGVFGDSSIILPRDAAVAISANATFGNVTVLDQHKKGFSSELQNTTPSFGSSPKRLRISITKVFGDVRVY